MHSNARNFVRALLPVAVIALCNGCGGGGSGGSGSGAESSAPPPSVQPGQAPAPSPSPTPTPDPTPAPTPSPGQTPATGNAAPTISGAAGAAALVGAVYQFQPSASDPDGDPLTFTATNLPPWASVDSATGRITGTPTANDVGQYESISLTVADAAHQASLAPFTIVVSAAGSPVAGGASVNWVTPPSKVDGTPLDDLAGYRIAYGRTAEDLDNSVFIENPAATSYQFNALEGGVWYFAVIAVNASGLEGPPSIAVMKSI